MTHDQLMALLTAGVQHHASDIHFRVGEPPVLRINGALTPLKYDRLTPADTLAVCQLVVRDPDARAGLERVQELDTSFPLPGVARFRVNIYRQRGSLAAILRIVPPKVPTIEELSLPPVLKEIASYERGLVLVTGSTGSGKSSTLAAMVNFINETRRAHIVSIEDPIEFLHSNQKSSVSQREIGPDSKSFQAALRSALRQDPDVILVGEMRDAESIDIALKAAETGHMVFSTVHTPDAVKTIGRLVSVFSSDEQTNVRYRLADALKATVSQRLLPRIDGAGRVLAAEIMIVTSTVQDLIRDVGRTGLLKDTIEKGGSQYGMQSFDQHLKKLYEEKRISLEVATQYASNPADFQRALSFE